jgi:hypothetical protein
MRKYSGWPWKTYSFLTFDLRDLWTQCALTGSALQQFRNTPLQGQCVAWQIIEFRAALICALAHGSGHFFMWAMSPDKRLARSWLFFLYLRDLGAFYAQAGHQPLLVKDVGIGVVLNG